MNGNYRDKHGVLLGSREGAPSLVWSPGGPPMHPQPLLTERVAHAELYAELFMFTTSHSNSVKKVSFPFSS